MAKEADDISVSASVTVVLKTPFGLEHDLSPALHSEMEMKEFNYMFVQQRGSSFF